MPWPPKTGPVYSHPQTNPALVTVVLLGSPARANPPYSGAYFRRTAFGEMLSLRGPTP